MIHWSCWSVDLTWMFESCQISKTQQDLHFLMNYMIAQRPYTDTVLSPSAHQYRPQLSPYHQESTSTSPCWLDTAWHQLVLHYIRTDPIPPSINQNQTILAQYHDVPARTAMYWPSAIKYQPGPPYILTQYHQVPTNNTLYGIASARFILFIYSFVALLWNAHFSLLDLVCHFLARIFLCRGGETTYCKTEETPI